MGCKPKSDAEGMKICLSKGFKYYGYCYTESIATYDSIYKDLLYTIDTTTTLVYPKIAEGCIQFAAAFLSTTSFCSIPTSSNCKSTGLVYTDTTLSDPSSSSCKGTTSFTCRLPSQ